MRLTPLYRSVALPRSDKLTLTCNLIIQRWRARTDGGKRMGSQKGSQTDSKEIACGWQRIAEANWWFILLTTFCYPFCHLFDILLRLSEKKIMRHSVLISSNLSVLYVVPKYQFFFVFQRNCFNKIVPVQRNLIIFLCPSTYNICKLIFYSINSMSTFIACI